MNREAVPNSYTRSSRSGSRTTCTNHFDRIPSISSKADLDLVFVNQCASESFPYRAAALLGDAIDSGRMTVWQRSIPRHREPSEL